jgi:hypothetical protein
VGYFTDAPPNIFGSSLIAVWVNLAGIFYDKSGNLKNLQRYKETGALIDNLTYNYASSNRVTSITDAAGIGPETWDTDGSTFTYDANGNVTFTQGPIGSRRQRTTTATCHCR